MLITVDGQRKKPTRYNSWARTVRHSKRLLGRDLTCKDIVQEWRGTIELAQLYHLAACWGFSEGAVEEELFRADETFEDRCLESRIAEWLTN